MDKNKKTYTVLFLAGIIAGFLLAFVLTNTNIIPTRGQQSLEEVEQKVIEAYSLANPGASIEIINSNEYSGLYEIIITNTGTGQTYEKIYTTKDGEFMTQVLTNITEFSKMLTNRKKFLECLENNGVEIYGALQTEDAETMQATQLQIQLLGGVDYLENIYNDCSGALEECAEHGIENLPTVVYEGQKYEGIKDYQWFEANVGCTIE